MDTNQMKVFEALRRNRLICPFREELLELSGEAKRGDLTSDEENRLKVLDAAYAEMEKLDGAFHDAMERKEFISAAVSAQAALKVIEDVYPKDSGEGEGDGDDSQTQDNGGAQHGDGEPEAQQV